MSVPSALPAGKTIRRDPNQLPLAPHLIPFLRLSDPYDLFLGAGCGHQLDRASVLENRGPVATHAEVLVHKTEQETFIVLVPRTDDSDKLAEPLLAKNSSRGAFIRTAGDVLMAAGIALKPDRHYYMETGLTQLDGLGWVVAANWTQATDKPPKFRLKHVDEAEVEAVEAEIAREMAEEEAAASEE